MIIYKIQLGNEVYILDSQTYLLERIHYDAHEHKTHILTLSHVSSDD
jgi:hypothetical protein